MSTWEMTAVDRNTWAAGLLGYLPAKEEFSPEDMEFWINGDDVYLRDDGFDTLFDVTEPEYDYMILVMVKQWLSPDWNLWCGHLERIVWNRYLATDEARDIGVDNDDLDSDRGLWLMAYYEPGDYAHAAYLTRTEQ